MFFDTHCHLDFAVFDQDRERLLKQAAEMGIVKCVVPGVSLQRFPNLLTLRDQFPHQIQIALGLHPCFIHEHPANAVEMLADQLNNATVCALGEMGLDGRPGMASEAVQQMLLEAQLKMARDRDLPVILHVVKAHEVMLRLLKRYALPRGGVVHAYSGSQEQAKHYAKLGFKLGFGGAITYARAHKQHRMVRELPLEWMVLETDAPDMPLEGYQDQLNSPLQVVKVAERMAELRQQSVQCIAEQTLQNAMDLFRIDQLS